MPDKKPPEVRLSKLNLNDGQEVVSAIIVHLRDCFNKNCSLRVLLKVFK